MCCTTTPNAPAVTPFTLAGGHSLSQPCGCGCLGNEPSALALDRYREHLKAELSHVETRIAQLDQDKQ